MAVALPALRKQLLTTAVKFAPTCGFTNDVLRRSLETLRPDVGSISDSNVSVMFDRGFPIALVEHIAKGSNQAVLQALESRFGKENIIEHVKQANGISRISQIVPTESDVAVEAVSTKLKYIQPFAPFWADAVALEFLPSNVPFAVINMAEFSDTVAYHMERVSALSSFLKLADAAGDNKRLLEIVVEVLKDAPLSSTPKSEKYFGWFRRRAKLSFMYGSAATSMLGDTSPNMSDTSRLVHSLGSNLF